MSDDVEKSTPSEMFSETDINSFRLIIEEQNFDAEIESMTSIQEAVVTHPVFLETIHIDFSACAVSDLRHMIMQGLYTDDSLPYLGWHNFEDRYVRVERGMSGMAYEIVIGVSTGVAANVLAGLLLPVIQQVLKRDILTETDAQRTAQMHLVRATRQPIGSFQLLYTSETNDAFLYIYEDRRAATKHLCFIRKQHHIAHYRVYHPPITLDDILLQFNEH